MNWFSNFYGRVNDPFPVAVHPMDGAVVKEAVAAFGREWFFQAKCAERVGNGLKTLEMLGGRNKEAGGYDDLVAGVLGAYLEAKEVTKAGITG